MSNSDAVIQMKLVISLLLGIAWFTDWPSSSTWKQHNISEMGCISTCRGIRHFGLLELPLPHMKRTKSVQYVYITMSCLRTHLKDAHKMIRRHKFNKSFTITLPGRITEKAGFSRTLIWTSHAMWGHGNGVYEHDTRKRPNFSHG
jgi:hypothetical protein